MGRTNSRIIAGVSVAATALAFVSALAGHSVFTQASAETTQAASDTVSVFKERVLLYERSFRPSTYDASTAPTLPKSGQAESVGMTSRDTYAAPETVQGFRIQVMNTNSFEESAAMRTTLLEAFDTWWIYVMFDSPTYKVRIGDFATRLEAKSALEQIQAKGFPNAWLVPDKVVLHLPRRLPLPAPIDTTLVK